MPTYSGSYVTLESVESEIKVITKLPNSGQSYKGKGMIPSMLALCILWFFVDGVYQWLTGIYTYQEESAKAIFHST
jgi:hypothetical protein